MKKISLKTTLIAIMAIGLLGCSKNSSTPDQWPVPNEVRNEFTQRFPNATRVEWEFRANIIKADFVMSKTEYDAWFENSGAWKWIRTEQDLKPSNSSLPAAVNTYLTTTYPGWRIDDINYITTPSVSYFEVELEKRGEMDVTLFIKEDGTVLHSFIDNDIPDNYINPSTIPSAVREAFNTRYPKAIRIKWEMQGPLYEVEFINDNFKHESLFKADGAWVRTEIDLTPKTAQLSSAILSYISTNYPGWRTDDVDLIQVPEDEYFEIELEKAGQPDVTLLIRRDGSIVHSII